MLLTIEEYCKLTDIELPTELVRGVLVRHNFPFLIHGIVCANIRLKTAHVFEPSQPVRLLSNDDEVSLTNILPGLSFPTRQLFE